MTRLPDRMLFNLRIRAAMAAQQERSLFNCPALEPAAEPVKPAVILDLFIPGEAKPQPRSRAFARKMGEKYVARVYDASTAEGWKSTVAWTLKPHLPFEPLTGPVSVSLTFYLSRPQSLMRKRDPEGRFPHTVGGVKGGDCDNYAKAVLDCLTKIGLWHDDKQVYRLEVEKWYVAKSGRPGMQIRVERV